MKRVITAPLVTVALGLALAACGDAEEDVVVEDTDLAANVTDDEYDPMTADYELSEDAATRRAEFDEAAFNTEYRRFRDDIAAESDTEDSMTREMDASREAMGEDAREMDANTMPNRDGTTNMRSRREMTWSYLDRNDDGQLSVAEYAIWAIPLSPNNEAMNDQGEPELQSETINRAADSFFYYDQDGDSYLSQREFTSARRGDRIG